MRISKGRWIYAFCGFNRSSFRCRSSQIVNFKNFKIHNSGVKKYENILREEKTNIILIQYMRKKESTILLLKIVRDKEIVWK